MLSLEDTKDLILQCHLLMQTLPGLLVFICISFCTVKQSGVFLINQINII